MTDKSEDGNNGARQLPLKKDAFLVKPIILVVVLFFIATVIWYADNSFFLLLIDFSALIISVVFLVAGIRYIMHGHYKSAMSLILAIPVLILAFALPSNGIRNFGYAYDAASYIKFTLHEKQYLEAVRLTQPDEKGFRYKEFIWSIYFGGEGTRLIYDESDELGLPEASRSKAWWEKVGGHEGYFSCLSGVYKIKSHFYVVRLICG